MRRTAAGERRRFTGSGFPDDCGKMVQSMEEDAYEVVIQYVKADELIQVKDEYRGKDGKINMCQALKKLIEDGRK